MDKPRLNILLLGPPVVTLDGKLLKINRRQHRAFLYFLAGKIQPLGRSEICEIFWPDESVEKARKNIREVLSRLRSDLGSSDYIISLNDQLALNYSLVWTDALAYQKIVTPLLSSSEMNSSSALPDWMILKFKEAIQLCRTPLFLHGLQFQKSNNFQNWLDFTDQAYDYSRTKIVERLATHYIAVGNLEEAIVWLGKGLEKHPLDEDLNFLMLNCLLESGKIHELTNYSAYLENCFSELKEPFPAKLAAFRARSQNRKKSSRDTAKNTWPVVEERAVGFVGRQTELEQLEHAFNRRGMIFLRGESGSGKTRLLEEFYSRIPFPPRLIYCRGHQLDTQTPFQPLFDGLRSALKQSEIDTLLKKGNTNLEILYPELENKIEPTHFPVDGGSEALKKIFVMIEKILEQLAEDRSFLLAFDDAQWSDRASLSAISYLSEQGIFRKQGLLILASRDEEPNEILNQFVLTSLRQRLIETINLEPFSEIDIEVLIQNILGQSMDNEFQERLAKRTGGNPLFLIESLRSIKELRPGLVTEEDASDFPVSVSIGSIVQEKMSRLSESALSVLFAAAALGDRCTPDTLEGMVDLDSTAFVKSVEELRQLGILAVDSQVLPGGGYRFTHDVTREVVSEGMDPARRRYLHLRAAKVVIERRGESPELASSLATHFEKAGEPVQAYHYWLAAGRFARSRFSKLDTYIAYDRALKQVRQVSFQFDEDTLQQVFIEWGDYAYDLSDAETCERIYQVCFELGERHQSALLIGTGLSGLGRASGMRADVDKSLDFLNRAEYFLNRSDSTADVIENFARIGIAHTLKNDYISARQVFEKALELEESTQSIRCLDAMVNVKTQLGILYCMMGEPALAEALAEQALNHSSLVPRRSAKVEANVVLCWAEYYRGKYQEALRRASEIRKTTELLGMAWWVSLLDILTARVSLTLGRLDDAWEYCARIIDAGDQNNPHQFILFAYAMQGEAFRLMGDHVSADKILRNGFDLHGLDFSSLLVRFLYRLNKHQQSNGRQGAEEMRGVLDLCERIGLNTILFPAKITLLNMNKQLLDPETFMEQIERIGGDLREHGFGASWTGEWMAKGRLCLETGNLSGARAHFTKTAEFAQEIGDVWIELGARKCLLQVITKEEPLYKTSVKRAETIFNEMNRNTRSEPLREAFRKFRNDWL